MTEQTHKHGAGIQLGFITLLFAWFHFPAVRLLADYAENDPNWSHAFVIPFLGAYMLYTRWDKLKLLEQRPNPWGIAVVVVGVTVHLWALSAPSPTLLGYSMILELLGITLALFGAETLRLAWFPICFLGFAVRITTFWDRFAGAMQRVATELAGALLNATAGLSGLRAEVKGAIIVLYDNGRQLSPPLSVDEACSGLRMLVAIIAVATALAFLTSLRTWRAAILIGSAIPISILVNVIRLAALGWLFPNHPNLATGNFHVQLGAAMFVPSFILLLAVQIALAPPKQGKQP